jgi:hypothetical protein
VEVVTRAQWGARAPLSRHLIATPTPELWIHHSAGALDAGGNGVWWDDVRGIQDFHMDGRGWSDIAYSFLVGGGRIFEGRGAGVAGGHTKGHNTISHAICLIGNYDEWQPQPGDLEAIAQLVRHGREQRWWGAITGGHRDASGASTACPGRHLEAAIPRIEALAQEEDDMPTTTRVLWYQGPATQPGNYAYQVVGLHGKQLGTAGLALCRRLGVSEPVGASPGSEHAPMGAEWQATVILVDGPCRNQP